MNYQLFKHHNENAAYVVFSSGLGGHGSFWQAQLDVFRQYFHVLVYDQEGCHASSELLADDYSFEHLALQVKQLLQQLEIVRFHFIGHALGGFIGIELAHRYASEQCQILSLTLINAWLQLDPQTLRCFMTRMTLLQYAGTAAYLHAQALFLYPALWISQHNALLDQQEAKMQLDFPPHANVLKRLNALMQYHVDTARIETLKRLPVCLIANQDDMLVPYTQSLNLWKSLPHAQLKLLPYGGHASTVTEAQQVNQLMIDFLKTSASA